MRQETINRKGFSLQQITRYIPLFRNIERKHLCTEFIPYPTDVFFVFLCVISTSAIYQYAARFQTRPDIRYDSPLPLLADFHILRAPLAYGNRVFAEHTLTGAGHVRQYHVEEIFQRCKVRRVAIGNHHIGMPPLGQILGKYLRAVADNLIGYQQTIVGKNASDMRRLTARSGAKVEHHYRFLTHILLQSLFNKHGRSFLHIITARMEQRIESKCRAFFQVKTGSTPGNGMFSGAESKRFQRIQPDADGLLRFQRSH